MENPSTRSHHVLKLSVWWKILFTLNIVLDVPFFVYAFTGYQWNCKYNDLPDFVFLGLTGISTLILVCFFIISVGDNPRCLDIIGTGLFSVLLVIVIGYSILAFFLSYSSGKQLPNLVQSPNTQRIAELCVLDCGPSCLPPHTLRVGYRLLPFLDLHVADLKYGPPEYFVPQIKWIDDKTISVIEADNKIRTFHASFIRFNWQAIFAFVIYAGIKYGYVLLRLKRQH
jgi:hypothetical protein